MTTTFAASILFEMQPESDGFRHPSTSPLHQVPDTSSEEYSLPQYLKNLENSDVIHTLIPIPSDSRDYAYESGSAPSSKKGKSAKNPSPEVFSPESSAVPSTPGPDGKKGGKVSDRRAEQNRQAQKTFREKKLRYVKDLEDQLDKANQESRAAELLKQENIDLRNVIASLQSENDRLREEKTQLLNFTWTGPIPTFEPNLPVPKSSDFHFGGQPQAGLSSFAKSSAEGHRAKSAQESAAIPRATFGQKTNQVSSPSASASPYDSSSSPSSSAYDTSSPVPHVPFQSEYDGALGSDNYLLPQFTQMQHPDTLSLPSNGVPLSPAPFDWEIDSLLDSIPEQNPTTTAPHKRNLEEASFYNATPIPFIPIAFTKDEDANKDDTETEICELFKKIHCKDKNPENCHGSKFIKKAI